MKVTYWSDYITGNVVADSWEICNKFSLPNTSKSLAKKFTLISLYQIIQKTKCSMMILMGFSETPRICTFPELIRLNNKASLC